MKWIPSQLAEYRILEGLSMKAAAARCGLAPGKWSQLEHGYRQPTQRERNMILSHTRYPESFFTHELPKVPVRDLCIC